MKVEIAVTRHHKKCEHIDQWEKAERDKVFQKYQEYVRAETTYIAAKRSCGELQQPRRCYMEMYNDVIYMDSSTLH